MTFDVPHMIATALIIFAVIWGVDHTSLFGRLRKGRRTLIKLVLLFVLILVLNLVWPYGAGAS